LLNDNLMKPWHVFHVGAGYDRICSN